MNCTAFREGVRASYYVGDEALQKQDAAYAESKTLQQKSLMVVATVMSITLFIIGALGAAGYFNAAVLGWTAVGLSVGILGIRVIQLALLSPEARKLEMLNTLFLLAESCAIITIGILGGMGYLGATQVAWGILGSSLSSACVYLIYISYCTDRIKLVIQAHQQILSPEAV